MFLFLIILNNLIFNLWNHPLNLRICLFIKTLIICLIITIINYFSWFSFILFLVFVGGLLILLIYSISLVGNTKFFQKNDLLIQLFLILLGVGILSYINIYFDFLNQNDYFLKISNENNFILTKIFLFPGNIINIFLICYLFILLIIVTKITLTLFGPLRICKYLSFTK